MIFTTEELPVVAEMIFARTQEPTRVTSIHDERVIEWHNRARIFGGMKVSIITFDIDILRSTIAILDEVWNEIQKRRKKAVQKSAWTFDRKCQGLYQSDIAEPLNDGGGWSHPYGLKIRDVAVRDLPVLVRWLKKSKAEKLADALQNLGFTPQYGGWMSKPGHASIHPQKDLVESGLIAEVTRSIDILNRSCSPINHIPEGWCTDRTRQFLHTPSLTSIYGKTYSEIINTPALVDALWELCPSA